ncbi:MAG TPA: hypothetical protein VE267_09605, partial [Bradyrhizobium sp.]|nr:hypothetical protein [Bradyrhizobium sp.]
ALVRDGFGPRQHGGVMAARQLARAKGGHLRFPPDARPAARECARSRPRRSGQVSATERDPGPPRERFALIAPPRPLEGARG